MVIANAMKYTRVGGYPSPNHISTHIIEEEVRKHGSDDVRSQQMHVEHHSVVLLHEDLHGSPIERLRR